MYRLFIQEYRNNEIIKKDFDSGQRIVLNLQRTFYVISLDR